MKRMALFFLLLINLSQGAAREVAGISVPEVIQRDSDNAQLVLNGAGVREKFFFDVYIATLYLEQKSDLASAVLENNSSARVEMRMLYSEIEREKLIQSWNDGFSANLTSEQSSQLRERLDLFNNQFETLYKGDLVELDYFPGEGTRVRINGNDKATIPGYDFFQALLKIWIGSEPVTQSLKRDLLGQ
ncbi:MAG: chalcone isomerase family protein [Candidatus Thiodiazotropha sp. DIVDIV]